MTLPLWIKLLATAGVIACALALLIANLGGKAGARGEKARSASPAQLSTDPLHTYEGMITDSHCGAKHPAATGSMAGDCALACIRSGEQFSLVDGDKMYVLEGEPAALKHAVGQRVQITGRLNGKTLRVASVAANAS